MPNAISIIGAGNIGSGVGEKLLDQGWRLTYGVPQPDKPRNRIDGAEYMLPEEALNRSNLVLLAMPFGGVRSLLAANACQGKVIIDATTPMTGPPEGYASGAHAIADWCGCHVVKVFITTGSTNLRNPAYSTNAMETFICGDDLDAKDQTAMLAIAMGLVPVDTGGLEAAVHLENMARFWTHLAYNVGLGTGFAFQMVKRR